MCRKSVDYGDTSVNTVLVKVSKNQSQLTQPRHISEECWRVSNIQTRDTTPFWSIDASCVVIFMKNKIK